jgi:signal transduction histidine kinase
LGFFQRSFFQESLFKLGFRIFLGAVIAFLICLLDLESIESYLYDLRVRTKPLHSQSEQIAIILINSSTVDTLKRVPRAEDHRELLNTLKDRGPEAVVYDLDITEIEGSDEEKTRLAQTMTQMPKLFQVTDELDLKSAEKKKMKDPYADVSLYSGPRTVDKNTFGKDGVTRRLLITYQDQLMLHPYLAADFNSALGDKKEIRGLFPVFDSEQVYIDFQPKGSFETIPFEKLLTHPKNYNLGGKIVLIGLDLGTSFKDYVATPYSRNAGSMPTVEMQANMFDTLIKNSAPVTAPRWLNWLLVVAISILTMHVVLNMKPTKGLMVLLTTFACFVLACSLIFWTTGYWIAMAHPLLAIFLCYYFFIPYRLIVENRRSWEYYQKNQLLQQVEELKGNFISMMSHDLKTPLARIQGMTDVILAETTPLSSPQREAVDTIRQSSDDLLKFINAILNYGRIESEGVHLQLRSKDANDLLTEVIRKNEFLAKVKHIQITSELEPLFPIEIDPDLIRQVFSNLVENAIKYSPENTKIRVRSEEKDNKVIVQIIDHGNGIPDDELSNIFMKFFRSKNAKSSPIKGSGLGLYLAKYFIELHQGRIFVESSLGKGSTFTVELPMKQGKNHA